MTNLGINYFLDWIDRAEGTISAFINSDWRGSWRRAGPFGVIAEFVKTLAGFGSHRFIVEPPQSMRGIDLERELFDHGVKLFDRGVNKENGRLYIIFDVKRRQRGWANYLLVRMGCTVVDGHVQDAANYNRWSLTGEGGRNDMPIDRVWARRGMKRPRRKVKSLWDLIP